MVRSGDGKTRIDSGSTSVITDPKAQQVTVLDHLTKEARIMPMQSAPAPPPQSQPGIPAAAIAPPPFQPPPMHVQDLGKGVIEGHEVDGKRYIIQPPPPPQLPQPPKVAGEPPAPPKPPAPQMPTTADMWTSTKLGMPVMTQVTGPFGKQTSYHKIAETAEPNPSIFQVPPGYKQVIPPPSPIQK
jgi:hypothetical protein